MRLYTWLSIARKQEHEVDWAVQLQSSRRRHYDATTRASPSPCCGNGDPLAMFQVRMCCEDPACQTSCACTDILTGKGEARVSRSTAE